MLSRFKGIAEKGLRPLVAVLHGLHPNVITLLGIIFPVLFFLFVVMHLYLLALFVFIFNGLDMLDGMVARAHGRVTAFGGLLDSTIDRFSDFVVVVAFGFGGLVHWVIVVIVLLLTYLISYIRSRTELAAHGTLVANVGIIERAERLVGIFIGLCFYAIFPRFVFMQLNFVEVIFLVLIVLSAITVIQRMVFAYHRL